MTPPRAAAVLGRRWPRGQGGLDRRLGLTRRGLILVLIVFALTAMSVYPLRQYVAQRQRIEQLQAKHDALAGEVRRLEAERERLRDPDYVEQLAREELHVARPGEESWVLTGPPPGDRAVAAPPPRPERSWLRRILDGLLGRAG
ncbi:MAG TPA: septum formation initiator family protein [Actinomycetes bacterium]|nr:septum formation initiator family protein [Actinomycetes bacterium]